MLGDQGQGRDRQDLNDIPGDNQCPILSGFIGNESGNQPQRITAELSDTGNKAD